MEIERKFLIKELPANIDDYECRHIEQGYLNVKPAIRVRRDEDKYYMTYKGPGVLSHDEYNLPLDGDSFEHLITKADGIIIRKRRYMIPDDRYDGRYTIELDIFDEPIAPLILAEVEFPTEEEAVAYTVPDWLGEDVTDDPQYSNARMSRRNDPTK